MKYLPLIFANLSRKKLRTTLTTRMSKALTRSVGVTRSPSSASTRCKPGASAYSPNAISAVIASTVAAAGGLPNTPPGRKIRPLYAYGKK